MYRFTNTSENDTSLFGIKRSNSMLAFIIIRKGMVELCCEEIPEQMSRSGINRFVGILFFRHILNGSDTEQRNGNTFGKLDRG